MRLVILGVQKSKKGLSVLMNDNLERRREKEDKEEEKKKKKNSSAEEE